MEQENKSEPLVDPSLNSQREGIPSTRADARPDAPQQGGQQPLQQPQQQPPLQQQQQQQQPLQQPQQQPPLQQQQQQQQPFQGQPIAQAIPVSPPQGSQPSAQDRLINDLQWIRDGFDKERARKAHAPNRALAAANLEQNQYIAGGLTLAVGVTALIAHHKPEAIAKAADKAVDLVQNVQANTDIWASILIAAVVCCLLAKLAPATEKQKAADKAVKNYEKSVDEIDAAQSQAERDLIAAYTHRSGP